MRALLLLIPTKKTDDVNWTKPLTEYLLSVYGDTSEFHGDIKMLNKLRQDIRGAHAEDVGIGLYMRYFSCLELLDLRVPMKMVNKHKSMKFVWYDAFMPATLHEQYALPFEKANVLFNLGSFMSKAASTNYTNSHRSNGSDEAAFKTALQLMQQAAGVFQFLSENFLNVPSNDLSPATINFLINLCLAQSQEIFNLKVIDGDLEQKKNNLIARLCASTAQYYDQCFKVSRHLLTAEGSASIANRSTYALTDSGMEDFLSDEDQFDIEYDPDKSKFPDNKVTAQLDPEWVSTIDVKALYYKSLSYYFQALHLESSSKFGEAIAYLTKSSEILDSIPSGSLRVLSKSPREEAYILLDNFKYQKDAVEIKLKDIKKDNDLIYHDMTPNIATIPDIKPMDSAKIIPISKIEAFVRINERSYANFLNTVIPINVHELLSYYSEEKSQLLRAELDENDIASEKLASVLECLKLPKAVVVLKELIQGKDPRYGKTVVEDVLLPEEVLSKVNEISSAYRADVQYREDIRQRRDQIFELINNCQKNIEVIKFQNSSAKYREDLIRLKKTLYDAATSDSRLFELVDGENSQLFTALGRGSNSEHFKSLFAVRESKDSVANVTEEISLLDLDDSHINNTGYISLMNQIKTIEDILNDLNVLKTDRQNLVATLKKEIHKDDISNIIMLNSKTKSINEIKTEIFADELKKFDVFLKKLDVLSGKQESLVADLQSAWQNLRSNQKVKEVQALSDFKSTLLDEHASRILDFYEKAWKKYTAGLRKGAEIYVQLLKYAESFNLAVESEVQRNQIADSFTSLDLDSDPSVSRLYQRQELQNLQGFQSRPGQTIGPPVPPRMPSYNSESWANSSDRQSYGQSSRMQPEVSAGQSTLSPSQLPKRSDTLIYDQPSAYQPQMYNFFLRKA